MADSSGAGGGGGSLKRVLGEVLTMEYNGISAYFQGI